MSPFKNKNQANQEMSLSQAHLVEGNSRYNKVKGDKVKYSLLSPFTFIKKIK